jgi:3-hydroxyacyl-[acyl-carrier-protein] dehydratase
MLATHDILAVLPHRYPFLLVDRILELDEGSRVVGEKLVSSNEPFFQGHFPENPIMPGVLIVEALAQTGAVALLRMPAYHGRLAYLAGIEKTRFRRPVRPGDVLRLEVTLDKLRHSVGKAHGTATVAGQEVCSGELLFALDDAA